MMGIYAVRDDEAQTFGPAMSHANDAVARRFFSDIVNDATSTVGRYPDQFTLYFLGEYDEVTGVISPALNNLGKAESYFFEENR